MLYYKNRSCPAGMQSNLQPENYFESHISHARVCLEIHSLPNVLLKAAQQSGLRKESSHAAAGSEKETIPQDTASYLSWI